MTLSLRRLGNLVPAAKPLIGMLILEKHRTLEICADGVQEFSTGDLSHSSTMGRSCSSPSLPIWDLDSDNDDRAAHLLLD